MRTHDILKGGTVQRIAKMRRYRDEWNAKQASGDKRYSYRTRLDDGIAGILQARSHGIGKIGTDSHGQHYTGDGRMVCDDRTLSGLRDCGAVDELFPRLFDHKGWFADDFEDEIWRGRVWQLPARNGECLYLAGYTRPNAGDAVIGLRIFREDNPGDRWDAYANARDAAIRADSMAERDAEESRQYSERWQEASRHDNEREDARQELKDARMSARSALRSMRELIAAQVSCDAIEETRVILSAKLQRARADMRRAIATIERETAAIAELGMQGEF